MSFDAANPPFRELAAAHARGLLTPFTGGGLSRPACPDWRQLIEQLEAAASVEGATGTKSADLIRRASQAVRILRHKSPTALEEAIRDSMYRESRTPGFTVPPATMALAAIWWPLVLTTNYEALFLDAWNDKWAKKKQFVPDQLTELTEMIPVGRGRQDCQRVLNSTRGPDNPLLWALQGFIGRRGKRHPLADQLTIGHEEYRRQTHEAVHFRRAFAEIYRSRVLLFLGSGLQESYLLDLFGEALELLGTIGHFHYALVPKGETDPEFLRRRLQIQAIEYTPADTNDPGATVTEFLKGLRKALLGAQARTCQWGIKLDSAAEVTIEDARPDLSVVRGLLGLPGEGTAIAVSAGQGATRLYIGEPGKKLIEERRLDPRAECLLLESADGPHVYVPDPKLFPPPKGQLADPDPAKGPHVYRVAGEAIYVVVARDRAKTGSDARDSRRVATATAELMEQAARDGFDRVNSMLLSAGSSRTFPQHISLQEMVRGYCQWHAETSGPKIPLYIYVVDAAVTALLEGKRIDLLSMTDSSRIRFWVQVDIGAESPAPTLALAESRSSLEWVMEQHAIPKSGWTVSVRPAPTKDHEPLPVDELVAERSQTLMEFGLVNGSTLVFTRKAAAQDPA